jgi:3-isopropylmalate dehydratase small subunit
MTKGSPQSIGVDSKNPLLRKMAQLELAERQKNADYIKNSRLGVDLLREHIVEETIKKHPEATRESILQGMDDMGF